MSNATDRQEAVLNGPEVRSALMDILVGLRQTDDVMSVSSKVLSVIEGIDRGQYDA